jgi:hypothetical protein
MDPNDLTNWGIDWAWGVPLIVSTVVIHAYGLGQIDKKVTRQLNGKRPYRNLVIGATALAATLLHGFEGALWAFSYRLTGAMPDNRSAMLYSLNAVTSYGHENLNLAPRWQMMGALEALNGWILFGLTTAFLFTVIQKAWPRDGSHQE